MISMLGAAAPDAAAAATTTRQDAPAAAAAAGGDSSSPSAAQLFAVRGLQRIGREMDRLLCLACIWNLDVYCQFLVTRADGDEMAWGSSDATLDHWCAGPGVPAAHAGLVCGSFWRLAGAAGSRRLRADAVTNAPPTARHPHWQSDQPGSAPWRWQATSACRRCSSSS